MFLLGLATGSVGFLTSVGLLRLHLEIMALRYVISVAVAYGAFLAFVWLWIIHKRRHWNQIAKVGGTPRTNAAGIEEVSGAEATKSDSWPDWLDIFEVPDEGHS